MSKSRIEELEEENALLRYRLEEIEASIAETEEGFEHLPTLRPVDRRILALLLKCGQRTMRQIHQHLYAGEFDPPSPKIIAVFIFRIRRTLAPHGVEIKNIYGVGYELTPASIAILKRQPDASNCMLSPAQLSAFNAKCSQAQGEAVS